MRKTKLKAVIGVAAALCIILAVGAGLYMYENVWGAGEDAEGDQGSEDLVVINSKDYEITHNLENYLLIGTDNAGNGNVRDSATYKGQMADVLLLLVLDRTDNTYGVLQLDRDTIVEMPYITEEGRKEGTVKGQLCTAHGFGTSAEMSCENTVETVSTLLGGLPIDGYFSIHMDEIAALNHAVGGVEVTIEDDLTGADPAFAKGAVLTLTDEQAERFVRARMDVGDEDNTNRMQRQLQYMAGFKTKALKKVKEDSGFAEELYETLEEQGAVTDIPESRISVISNQIYKGEDLGTFRMEGEHTKGYVLGDGKEHAEFYPDAASIEEILVKLCGLEEWI